MASNTDLMQWEDDEEEIAQFVSEGQFQKQASVKIDKDKKVVHGFESVVAVLDMKDKQKETAFAQAFIQDLDKYVANVKQSRLSVIEALDEIDFEDLEGYAV